MAITRLGGANAISGTIPQGNIANSSLGAVTALPAGVGGKVLQIVHASDTTADNTSSGSFVASSLSASITPSATSSKIFINISVSSNTQSTTSTGGITMGAIYRQIASGGYSDISSPYILVGIRQNGTMWGASGAAMQYLDSPNTTSQCDYKLYYKLYSGTDALLSNNSTKKTITLMEIAG